MIRIIFILVLFLVSPSWGAVVYETSFDSSPDWTHQQTGSDQSCLSGCGMPTPFTMYRDGLSYCGSVGNNNFYIDSGAGYPSTTVSCYSGDKCLTFWNEGCVPGLYEDSDGNIGFTFTEIYEIYVAFRIRFRSDFTFTDDTQNKIFHLQYYTSGTPWDYFDSDTHVNKPLIIGGFYRYGSSVYFTTAERGTHYNASAYPVWGLHNGGLPDYNPEFNSDFDGGLLGNHDQVFRDGQWHHIEIRAVTNTGTAGSFNSDGIIQVWYDGVLKINKTNVTFNKNQPGYSRRGWKFLSVGGNNNQGVTPEQWYALDDLVISTTRIGTDHVIGGSDTTAPTVSGAYPSSNQNCTPHRNAITVGLSTDENATCRYSTMDIAYDSMSLTMSGSGTLAHSFSIAPKCDTTYDYYVRCSDSSGNKNTSSEHISFYVTPQYWRRGHNVEIR